jgi:hypothetical protein
LNSTQYFSARLMRCSGSAFVSFWRWSRPTSCSQLSGYEMLYRQMNCTRSCLGRWFRFSRRFTSGTLPFELKAEESTCAGQNSTQKPQALHRSTTIETPPFATRSPSQTVTTTAKFNHAGCDDAAEGRPVGVTNITATARPSTRTSRANPAEKIANAEVARISEGISEGKSVGDRCGLQQLRLTGITRERES